MKQEETLKGKKKFVTKSKAKMKKTVNWTENINMKRVMSIK